MEVMVGFRYLYGLIDSNVPLVGENWMRMEYCMPYSHYHKHE